jgi:hypothetical protein
LQSQSVLPVRELAAPLLLIARGQEVTPSLVVRIKNLTLNLKINDPVPVLLCRQPFVPSAVGTDMPSLGNQSTNDSQQIGNRQSAC